MNLASDQYRAVVASHSSGYGSLMSKEQNDAVSDTTDGEQRLKAGKKIKW
jgi:hypothetical protein